MMHTIEFNFTKPVSLVGDIIVWRTGDKYSHSWVVLDGVMYDPLPLKSKRHKPPIRQGDLTFHLTVNDSDFERVQKWCENWVGSYYDFIAIFGWLIGVKEIDSPHHTYCHEFCNEILNMIQDKKVERPDLISAQDVIERLTSMNAVKLY